jgi:hypothetical protein
MIFLAWKIQNNKNSIFKIDSLNKKILDIIKNTLILNPKIIMSINLKTQFSITNRNIHKINIKKIKQAIK